MQVAILLVLDLAPYKWNKREADKCELNAVVEHQGTDISSDCEGIRAAGATKWPELSIQLVLVSLPLVPNSFCQGGHMLEALQ